jgi:hypothetical protein
MKKYINKKSIIIASVMLLLLATVGTTLAYIFTETKPVENTFNPSKVSCAVVEKGYEPVSGEIQNISDIKSNVQIKNTGDTDAYIRVAVVVNWASADGSCVWAQKPADDDYTITYNLSNGWFNGGDGFYYYSKAVSPGESTSVLIDEAKQLLAAPKGTDGTQYYLSIEIVASAIQSTPETVVENHWGVTVENGVITQRLIKEG